MVFNCIFWQGVFETSIDTDKAILNFISFLSHLWQFDLQHVRLLWHISAVFIIMTAICCLRHNKKKWCVLLKSNLNPPSKLKRLFLESQQNEWLAILSAESLDHRICICRLSLFHICNESKPYFSSLVLMQRKQSPNHCIYVLTHWKLILSPVMPHVLYSLGNAV